MSIISVQAGAAEQYLERDPARARVHLGAVQGSARDALIAQARAGGLDARLVEQGERIELPPGVDLAAFRIVQEALTNARKHAGRVAAIVRVCFADSEIEVEVVNGPGGGRDGGGSGHGLVGMRERVRVYGGTLEHGPTADGGYRVAATLPAGRRAVIRVRMPNVDGIEATRRLNVHPGAPHILNLTTFDLDEYVYEALHAGAAGFLLKDAPPDRLADAVRTVAAGDSLLAPAVTRRLVERFIGARRQRPRAARRSRS